MSQQHCPLCGALLNTGDMECPGCGKPVEAQISPRRSVRKRRGNFGVIIVLACAAVIFASAALFAIKYMRNTSNTKISSSNESESGQADTSTAKSGGRAEVEVTIPEGYTLAQIFSLFEEKGVCAQDKLWETATNYDFDYDFLKGVPPGNRYRLEGYLFPDTYRFFAGDTPERAINKLLSTFNSKWKEEYTARAAELGYSLREIVIMASLIEKEAGRGDNKKVASVIYNRLDSDEYPHLQIDATIYYAREMLGVTDTPFSRKLESPYNTDVCVGLPAGPIANPGIRSIEAALYPEETDAYFYALGKEGVHEFFNQYDDFVSFIHSDKYGG